jgi:UDP-N-acetylglucosamine--N-acetylmuramyl-(pentapeptide) pyrophosphoryl-undecaprenol N-acetylglucosamine transferase
MIPLPTAADDHQRKNAEAMERAGGAKMLLQRDLSGTNVAAELRELIANPETISEMETAAKAVGRSDAAERAADLIDELKAKA